MTEQEIAGLGSAFATYLGRYRNSFLQKRTAALRHLLPGVALRPAPQVGRTHRPPGWHRRANTPGVFGHRMLGPRPHARSPTAALGGRSRRAAHRSTRHRRHSGWQPPHSRLLRPPLRLSGRSRSERSEHRRSPLASATGYAGVRSRLLAGLATGRELGQAESLARGWTGGPAGPRCGTPRDRARHCSSSKTGYILGGQLRPTEGLSVGVSACR
jgi:hypothetical protein